MVINNTILQGPAEEQLKTIDSDSIDLIVTDPPYGYSFMNKDWDKAVVGVDVMERMLACAKSGSVCFHNVFPTSGRALQNDTKPDRCRL